MRAEVKWSFGQQLLLPGANIFPTFWEQETVDHTLWMKVYTYFTSFHKLFERKRSFFALTLVERRKWNCETASRFTRFESEMLKKFIDYNFLVNLQWKRIKFCSLHLFSKDAFYLSIFFFLNCVRFFVYAFSSFHDIFLKTWVF